MKLAIIGYGKMGKAIEQIALERGHSIHAIVSKAEELPNALGADCCIEFTRPDVAYTNLSFCIENGLPVVCGTTAWYEHFDALKGLVKEKGGSLLTATNFSIGVNLFFKLNEELARLMNNFPEYGVSMEETHHMEKLDHPSGTATTLAQGIISKHKGITDHHAFLEGESAGAAESVLPILCKREPRVPGTHKVRYHSAIDDITIEHKAHNRKGFASGAVLAAEWLPGHKGVFTMKDVLGV